jgi:hypothetical protein
MSAIIENNQTIFISRGTEYRWYHGTLEEELGKGNLTGQPSWQIWHSESSVTLGQVIIDLRDNNERMSGPGWLRLWCHVEGEATAARACGRICEGVSRGRKSDGVERSRWEKMVG